jgi:hypothetical protein
MASRLTTVDNPFDPFTQWTHWYKWDLDAGFDTTGYLARIVVTSDELSEADQEAAIEEAIDEILTEHPEGPYKRVLDPEISERQKVS